MIAVIFYIWGLKIVETKFGILWNIIHEFLYDSRYLRQDLVK
jgi:hypothetical protein